MTNYLLASYINYPAKSRSGKAAGKRDRDHRPDTVVEKRDKEGTLDASVFLQPVNRSDLDGVFLLVRKNWPCVRWKCLNFFPQFPWGGNVRRFTLERGRLLHSYSSNSQMLILSLVAVATHLSSSWYEMHRIACLASSAAKFPTLSSLRFCRIVRKETGLLGHGHSRSLD